MGDLHDLRIGKVERTLHAHGLVILQVQDDLGLGVVDDAFPKPSFIQVKEVIQVLAGADSGAAVSKLMGHAKELITMDVYADNRGIIADGVPEIEEYMKEVLPNPEEIEIFKKELLEIVIDVTEFLPDAG